MKIEKARKIFEEEPWLESVVSDIGDCGLEFIEEKVQTIEFRPFRNLSLVDPTITTHIQHVSCVRYGCLTRPISLSYAETAIVVYHVGDVAKTIDAGLDIRGQYHYEVGGESKESETIRMALSHISEWYNLNIAHFAGRSLVFDAVVIVTALHGPRFGLARIAFDVYRFCKDDPRLTAEDNVASSQAS